MTEIRTAICDLTRKISLRILTSLLGSFAAVCLLKYSSSETGAGGDHGVGASSLSGVTGAVLTNDLLENCFFSG